MLWFLLTLFAFIGLSSAQSIANRSVVVYVSKGDEIIGQGSGVAIGEGYILTVSHLLNKQPHGSVDFTVIYGDRQYKAVYIRGDSGGDGLMLLAIKINIPYVKFEKAEPLEKVLIYGNTYFVYDLPLYANVIREVEKKNIRTIDMSRIFYEKILFLDRPVINGLSGSGIWKNKDTLCGIVWGGIVFHTAVFTTAVTADDIISFLKR